LAFLSIGPNAARSEEAAASKSKEAASPAASKKAESQKPAPRVRWTTSRVVGSPEPPYPYVFRRAFPGLKFDKPVYMVPEPGTDRIFILQYPNGLVFAIRDDQKTSETKQILRFPVGKEESCECLSIIFHPNYVKNRQVFIFANVRRREGANGQRQERDQIWRFHVAETAPFAIVPESGEKIVEWTSAGHDGGDMAFGPDGDLYIAAGDGTTGSDPDITGQDITDLKASILRIDVDHPAPGKPYSVPKDNPFLHIPNARPEIWAFGVRNPWRMSFDPATGNLWLGDVGQDLWEMIYLVRRGGNYGWSVMEGSHPFYPERKIGPAPISPPIVEHHHSEARSITGGYVYHGKRLPELANHYLYCCYQTGTVWGFRYENGKVLDHRVLADSTYNCAAWGRDHANELYLIALSGEILQLDPNPRAKEGASKFPELLSQTGIFESVPAQKPARGVLSYSVNTPGWHDGASMTRLLAVPNDDTINAGSSRGWEFLDGAVAVQTLSLEMEHGNPASRKVIETRLMTRQGGEWAGYSYEWNDEQTDARLVPKEGRERKFRISDAAVPGAARQQTWRFLSRAECMVCHSRAANFVLGLSTLQLNRPHESAAAENQLALLQRAGYLKPPLSSPPDKQPRLVNPYDQSAALEPRVRSYLHANCSQCHVADGGGNARMELEFTTARDKMNVIGVAPLQGKFEIPEAELIAPGDPFRSVMLYRISKLGGGRMPQVGSSVVDRAAVKLFHDWIVSLPAHDDKNPARSHLAEQRKREEKSLASLKSARSPPRKHQRIDAPGPCSRSTQAAPNGGVESDCLRFDSLESSGSGSVRAVLARRTARAPTGHVDRHPRTLGSTGQRRTRPRPLFQKLDGPLSELPSNRGQRPQGGARAEPYRQEVQQRPNSREPARSLESHRREIHRVRPSNARRQDSHGAGAGAQQRCRDAHRRPGQIRAYCVQKHRSLRAAKEIADARFPLARFDRGAGRGLVGVSGIAQIVGIRPNSGPSRRWHSSAGQRQTTNQENDPCRKPS
jgi:uncharacterized repeat protein (TIGR03806 family)